MQKQKVELYGQVYGRNVSQHITKSVKDILGYISNICFTQHTLNHTAKKLLFSKTEELDKQVHLTIIQNLYHGVRACNIFIHKTTKKKK